MEKAENGNSKAETEVEDRGALSLVFIGSAVKTVRLQQVAAQVLKERRKLKLGKG